MPFYYSPCYWFCVVMALWYTFWDVRAAVKSQRAESNVLTIFHFWRAFQLRQLSHTWMAAAIVIGALR